MSIRHHFAFAALPLLAAVALVPAAQPPEKGKKSFAAIPANAFAVVSLDVAKVWDHPAFVPVREARGKLEFAWMLESLIGVAPAELDRVTLFWTPPAAGTKEPSGPYLLVHTRKPIDAKKVASLTTRKGVPALPKPADPRVQSVAGAEFPHFIALDDRTLLMGPTGTDPKRLVAWADQRGTDESLAGTIDKSALVVAVNPEALAGLPLPFGGPLVEAKTAVFRADLTGEKSGQVTLALTFASAEKAKATAPLLKVKLDELRGWLEARYKQEVAKPTAGTALPAPLLEWLAGLLKGTTITTEGAVVTAASKIDLGDAVYRAMLAIPDSGFAATGTAAAENNLKQILLAMHNYHSAVGHLPSNSYDKDGKPLLSWRVHILAYIEQDALYRQFKLDEPWDSPNNKPLSDSIVKVYQVPGRPTAKLNETYFRAFILPKGVKPADGRPYLTEGDNKGPSLATFPDGTSNTWLVVEAGESVPWAKPDDLPYDGKLPLPVLGGPSGRYTAGFADGSVRTFRRNQIDETNMRRLITRDDGNVVVIPNR